MRIALTGHRLDKLGGYAPCAMHDWCREQIRRAFVRLQPTEVISGMALGWDTMGAEVALQLHIPYIAALPFPEQAKPWPAESRRIHAALLVGARYVHTVSPRYEKGAFQDRNIWMVDQLGPSDVLLAGFDGTAGGTLNCLKYARASAAATDAPHIEIIDPRDFYKPVPA